MIEPLEQSGIVRRVILLETDESAGLVAAIAEKCHQRGVSLEITTGLSHVLLTFAADRQTLQDTSESLKTVPGVSAIHVYEVMPVTQELLRS